MMQVAKAAVKITSFLSFPKMLLGKGSPFLPFNKYWWDACVLFVNTKRKKELFFPFTKRLKINNWIAQLRTDIWQGLSLSLGRALESLSGNWVWFGQLSEPSKSIIRIMPSMVLSTKLIWLHSSRVPAWMTSGLCSRKSKPMGTRGAGFLVNHLFHLSKPHVTDRCGEAPGSWAAGGQAFLGSGDVWNHKKGKVSWWSFKMVAQHEAGLEGPLPAVRLV